METKTDIFNELSAISPLIAGIKKVNIFTVPDGYFDSISTTVLACLHNEDEIFNTAENAPLAGVPAGYFDQLADVILGKIKTGENALDEIRNLSPLLYGLQNKNPFEVPRDYFDQLSASVLDKVNAGENALEEIRTLSPLLYNIQNKNVFEVPEGYFAGLDTAVTDKIQIKSSKEELKEISPLLYGIPNKDVFEVPAAYFDGLANNILKKVSPPTAKVVVMHKRGFIKYAIAAVLAGATALGIYKSIDQPAGVNVENHPALATTLDASIEKGKSMNDQQFNEALANLNDADIAKYLENNGDVADVAALNNNLEDVKLPSQDDYLIDESTLENYLKEIEKTTVNN